MTDTAAATCEDRRRKIGRIGQIVALIILLLCILFLGWKVLQFGKADEGAVVTQYEGMTREEIQAELDRTVRENMMTVSVAPTALLDENGDVAVNVINEESNRFPQRFSLFQDGEVVYRSGTIDPGKTVSSCHPDHISAGPAVIEIQALDPESSEDHGSPTRVDISIVEADKS